MNYLSTGSTHTTAKVAMSLNRTERKLSHLLLSYTPSKVPLVSDSIQVGMYSWDLTNKTRTGGFKSKIIKIFLKIKERKEKAERVVP